MHLHSQELETQQMRKRHGGLVDGYMAAQCAEGRGLESSKTLKPDILFLNLIFVLLMCSCNNSL